MTEWFLLMILMKMQIKINVHGGRYHTREPQTRDPTNLAELLSSVVVPLHNRYLTQNLSQEVLVVITEIQNRYKN